ncbi:MAG: 23S rRNA pseudouridine(2604) synthase RluF [Bacteroidales bacterium]
MDIRLNKVISDSGLCSRREADNFIETGRVTVNGKQAEVGMRVRPIDVVRVDGHIIKQQEEAVYIALNKPVGITCTTDQTDPDNIIDFVNYPNRIFNIGRLDKDSEGLILLTNDGGIVNKILRASNNHEKEYEVMVNKPITEEFIQKMASGVPILGTMTRKCKVEKEADNRFRITLTQGLNRQIRRMCEALGYDVMKLKRVRIMNISIAKLPLGQWRFLTENELSELMELVKDSDDTPKAKSGGKSGQHAKPKSSTRPSKTLENRSSSSKAKSTGSKRIGKSKPKTAEAAPTKGYSFTPAGRDGKSKPKSNTKGSRGASRGSSGRRGR